MPETIPNSPLDGTHIYDDFLANSAVANGTVGRLKWVMTTIASQASVPTFIQAQNGVMRITTEGTTNGNGEAFTTDPDGITLAGGGQFFRFRVRYPQIGGNVIAANNFRIGFSASVTATEPDVGVWVDSDAGVISFDGASTNGDITQAVTGAASLTSGTTMILGTWHEFAIFMEGTNVNGGPKTLKLFVDGAIAGTIENFLLGSTETMEFGIVHWQDQGTGQHYELDIDYIEAWLPR